MITKLAKSVIGTDIKPHQQRVLDRLDSTDGVVAYHSLGSGKTLTSLLAAQRALSKPKKPGGAGALFLVPAPLAHNIDKEIAKHHIAIPKDRLKVMTYDKAVRHLPELTRQDWDILVADEAHKLRNTGTARAKAVRELAARSAKRLLLTGSLAYHEPADIGPLVNLAAGKKVLPGSKEDFDSEYLIEKTHKPSLAARLKGARAIKYTEMRNVDRLVENIKGYVDRHNSAKVNPEDFPEVSHKVVKVEMDPSQRKMYDYFAGKMPRSLAYKIRMGLPLDKKESRNLNAFAGAIRQVSDSVAPYVDGDGEVTSPKLDMAIRSMRRSLRKDPRFKGIVYSNYLDAALDPYSRALDRAGIPYHKFTGAVSAAKKKAIVDDFNSDKAKARVLLLSSSGGEGLDLRGVRKAQVLEPHWNAEKIHQFVGRGSRYKSHEHLPFSQRNMEVEHYLSTMPKSFWGKLLGSRQDTAIDEYLYDKSMVKDNLIGRIRRSLEEES